jgi:hypothetical protein
MISLTDEELEELFWTVGEHRRICRDQSKNGNVYMKNKLDITEAIMIKLKKYKEIKGEKK